MPRRLERTPRALVDLVEHYEYLGRDGLDAAERFLVAVEAAFERLSTMPGIGAPLEVSDLRLSGMRRWAVSGFRNHLIFYLERGDRIQVVPA
jgi:toxin ParE1/3/4